MRWLIILIIAVLAVAAGFFAGYIRWGTRALEAEHVRRELQRANTDLTALQAQKQDLAQRLDEVNREQQRLAQENEILRKQETTEYLPNGQEGGLPSLPPK